MEIKTYQIYCLGCKVNQYDARKLEQVLNSFGLRAKAENTDLLVIYTCSVTKTAQIKNKRVIKRAKKLNPHAKIALAGCWPRVDKIAKTELGIDFIISDSENKTIERILNKKIKKSQIELSLSQPRARYFIKVQDGCEQFCSYCIIPYARGKQTSRSRKDILAEINDALKYHYQEFVLSGIHLGLYSDGESYQLLDLVKDILKIKRLGRLRLSSIELNEVSVRLGKLMADESKLCRHLHIPLQSGSDKILKLMNRPYKIDYFIKKVNYLRKLMPHIALTTDVIVGFPGESDADFAKTIKQIKKIKFSRLHVFPFSAHEKTPAFYYPHQVDKKTITKRAALLRSLGEKLQKEYCSQFRGEKIPCVLEDVCAGNYRAKSEYYFDLRGRDSNLNKLDVGKIFSFKST